MTGESLNVIQDQLEKLKQLFPETITEGKIDWEKLQATLGKENIEFSNERYVLNWAGKSESFKVLQQSTTATLKPVPEESVNFDTTENIFIEGENLEVLKVLQKAYYNKIKCIIIDPPYNTGNDSFIYPDSFKESKADYEKRIGEKDEDGYLMKEGFFRKNSKDSGHYHSNWLSMMYPRLFLAKNLLRDDGVIFVHIDDNEVHNLRMIMNEIFGEENFLAQFIWQKKNTRENRSIISVNHEYILLYGKENTRSENLINLLPMGEDAEARYKNPDNDLRGVWTSVPAIAQAGHGTKSQFYTLITPSGRKIEPPSGSCWRYTIEKMKTEIKSNNIWFGSDGNGVPRIKKFLTQGKQGLTPITILAGKNIGTTDSAKRNLVELFDGIAVFETPKPYELATHLIKIGCTEDDLILDFFGGSGTTAHAVLELNKEDGGNRKFILVQLPEPCDEGSEAFKAGYKTIADISKERIRRVIKRLNQDLPDSKITMIKGEEAQQKLFTEKENQANPINPTNQGSDNGFKVFKLSSSNFKIWQGGEITDENLEQQLEIFTNPVREGSEKENMLYELILKSGYLLTAPLSVWRGVGGEVYSINNGELIIALEEMNQELIDTIIASKPKKVITLDQLFTGNDQLKTNAVLQMKDAEIDFKTI